MGFDGEKIDPIFQAAGDFFELDIDHSRVLARFNFLRVASEIPIRTRIQIFPLSEANRVLNALKNDAIPGAAVLRIGE